ncbi:MAG: hypothetical protein ABFD24_11050 [Anaerolineaceae bacterium]
MATYDFSALESKFAEIVAMMPDPFDSHEFLLALAEHNQTEYVKALYAYKDSVNKENPSPFQVVHMQVMKRLNKHPELVKEIRKGVPSKDIFGNPQTCSEWQKVK